MPESPQPVPLELNRPKLLIGEGRDEVFVFGALLKFLGIDDVSVEEYGGKFKLPDYLDALRLRPGFIKLTSIGVTRDADLNAADAFRSVSGHLEKRHFATPEKCGIVAEGMPRVGVIIFPDGVAAGTLEDLFLFALQPDNLLFQCIDDYFECIRVAKNGLPKQISKARLHAWLASQDPPDMRLGIAAQRNLIDWNAPPFSQLVGFLKAL